MCLTVPVWDCSTYICQTCCWSVHDSPWSSPSLSFLVILSSSGFRIWKREVCLKWRAKCAKILGCHTHCWSLPMKLSQHGPPAMWNSHSVNVWWMKTKWLKTTAANVKTSSMSSLWLPTCVLCHTKKYYMCLVYHNELSCSQFTQYTIGK